VVDKLTILTSIHVLAAALWVGTAFSLNLQMAFAGRGTDPSARLAAMRFADFLGPRVFAPLTLITIGTGIWLAEDYYAWDLWVILGLIGGVAAMTIGFGYLGPKGHRMLAAVESGNPPDGPGAMPIAGMLNLLILIAVVAIMVIKPT
jgi:hypothetical protein